MSKIAKKDTLLINSSLYPWVFSFITNKIYILALINYYELELVFLQVQC